MIKLKQFTSLEKLRLDDELSQNEINDARVLKGEKFSYQVAVTSDLFPAQIKVSVKSEFGDNVELYMVKNSVMDFPTYANCTDTDYITKTPGLIPDMLVPCKDCKNTLIAQNGFVNSVWVRLNVPTDFMPGNYSITLTFSHEHSNEEESIVMNVEVLDIELGDHNIVATQWFHADCVASAHNVEIYSEKHWELIEKYISLAVDIGLNMILVPVITPPLDTAVGGQRECVQLVRIEKTSLGYSFDFSLFRRFISICQKCGIRYFEISHMFSQWGSKFAPNIYVWHNGELKHDFGWHTRSDSNEYVEFLKEFLGALCKELKNIEISSNTYFHISDEPHVEDIDNYKRAYNLLKPYISDCKTIDALSNYEFYREGLVECPVTASNHIEEFLKHNIPNQWVYYCCSQHTGVSNRFMAMPSYRNRIIGIQMYKFGIKGFLHWGYNFYNAQFSLFSLNPQGCTSSDMGFPSGDAFSVYPGNSGPYPSIRAFVFQEGLQDIALCRLVEYNIGHDRVVQIIEDVAGMELRFDKYPKSNEFFVKLRNRLIDEIL